MKKMLSLALVAASLTTAFAADFPIKDRPVTIVVPFTAGGPTDRVARDLAEAMRKTLGVSVVVDNAAGAGGSIGANKVAKATPDGHTLLLHHIGMSTMPTLVRNIPFKVESDFEYRIGLQGSGRMDRTKQGQGESGQRRHWIGLSSVRSAVPECHPGGHDHCAL
jgi:tripartite-type tricarboxylate transporter receptor subunit TctC